MASLRKHDSVFLLDLGDGDNRFNLESVRAIDALLDEVDQSSPPTALITTASGKIWHNGLDLEWLAETGAWGPLVTAVEHLFGRLMSLPMPTVAAVQGHAFAGGAMLALAHDVRVMREDRGYLCLPEVDLNLSFSEGFASIIEAKLPQPALHRMAVLGQRIPGEAAFKMGVVDALASESEVQNVAVATAGALSQKAGTAMADIRRNFYSDTINKLLHQ